MTTCSTLLCGRPAVAIARRDSLPKCAICMKRNFHAVRHTLLAACRRLSTEPLPAAKPTPS